MNIKGVLFDFDGVIADTMDFNYQCWREAFAEYGYALQKRDYLLMEGTGAKTIAEKFITCIEGKKPAWKEIQISKNKLFLAGYHLAIYPEIYRIVEHLRRRDIPFAMVTGSDRVRLESIIDKEFYRQFRGAVTMEDTAKGKPYADPYLKGAEILGVGPKNCVVVENAPAGIKAGKEAGAFTVGIMTTLSKEDLQEADLVFPSHHELLEWMEEAIHV